MNNDTLKYVLLALGGFLLVNSVLTVIFTTLTWLVNNYRWKAWVLIGILAMLGVYGIYLNLGKILILIQ